PWGVYDLGEVLKPGWTQSIPNTTVEVNGTNLNPMFTFRNIQGQGSVSGYKYNGTSSEGLSGWTIVLSNMTIGTFTTSTDGAGAYSFLNVPWGVYDLGEVLKPGWTQSIPNTTVEVNGTNLNPIYMFRNIQDQGSVSGFKYNGSTSEGLSGWTIVLGNQEIGTLVTTTDANGAYTFSNVPFGTYNLGEVPKAGWTQSASTPNTTITLDEEIRNPTYTFRNSRIAGYISGYKRDSEGNGLSGWTITLRNSSTGFSRSLSTDSRGFYNYTGLDWMSYTLDESPQPGWIQTGSPTNPVTINASHLSLVNQNFTNKRQGGYISGYKRDPAGIGLPGWRITLRGANGQIRTCTTDNRGFYNFTNLGLQEYVLTEVLKPGWIQVSSPVNPQFISGTHLSSINQNFTNLKQTGYISGYKRDASGKGLRGWTITLRNSTSGLKRTLVTDSRGFYNFTNLEWMSYSLTETMKPGWTQTVKPRNPVIIDGTHLGRANMNFSNMQKPGQISGFKVDDQNNDGIWQQSEPAMPGWTIVLLNKSTGLPLRTAVTGADGFYRFTNVPWGAYTLGEVHKAGWDQTRPNTTVVINGTRLRFIYNFTNFFSGAGLPGGEGPCTCPVTAYFTSAQAGPLTVKFTDASKGSPTQWSWSFGDGTTSTERNPLHAYAKSGTYQVKLYIRACECTGTARWVSYTQAVTVR
ncbi:MAG: PKD domain-containing protein, partial [Methanoregulaceae archaeon]|nr:PKD domain-containing protein [Methanoregulaceae archaeon]